MTLSGVVQAARRVREGQAMVEFALILPILLIIIFGVVEFGQAWTRQQAITDAARAGARVAVVADPNVVKPDSVYAAVNRALTGSGLAWDGTQRACPLSGTPGGPQAWVCVNGSPGATGSAARVDIWVPAKFLVVGGFLAWASNRKTITLKTSFTMRNE